MAVRQYLTLQEHFVMDTDKLELAIDLRLAQWLKTDWGDPTKLEEIKKWALEIFNGAFTLDLFLRGSNTFSFSLDPTRVVDVYDDFMCEWPESSLSE
jgi:hypothetical protein